WRLYRDVFAHHGPLAYLLPHALVAAFGEEGIRNSRAILAACAALAATAVAWSPLVTGVRARALAFATFLGALAPIWILQGLHFTLYQNLAGAAAAVVLAQVVLPSLLGARVPARAAIAGGAAAGLLPFAAYAYGPAAVLLGAASALGIASAPDGRRRVLPVAGWFALGALASGAAVLLWVVAFGDLRGFYVYHFHFNQKAYAPFIEYGWTDVFRNLEPSFAPPLLTRAVAVAAALAALAAAAMVRAGRGCNRLLRAAAFLVLVAALLLLNPRAGFGFGANALILAAMAVPAVVGGWLLTGTAAAPRGRGLALALAGGVVLAMELASHVAPSSPHGLPREALREPVLLARSDAPVPTLVRELVDPDERVEALVFRPIFYLQTGRRPASGQYYYLPWQASYVRSPVGDYRIDLCEDLRVRAPPVVYFDDWVVWGRYAFSEYAPCVARLIETSYVSVAIDPSLRVRRDRLIARWRPSPQLVPASAADRKALANRLAGLRTLALELASRPGACLVAAPAQGEPLAIGRCGTPDAQWDALATPDGVALVSGTPATCADVIGVSPVEGASVVSWTCTSGANQRVDLEEAGGGWNVRFRHSGLCLAVDATGSARQERCPERGAWVVRGAAIASRAPAMR
ncbi:MAG TPA: RICIN domain-containing protein, partial [Anaeromyxobacteraceae bacterium]|nr:RICIN domain-containing protein [Anaeromyxobacteraceae bacterium]